MKKELKINKIKSHKKTKKVNKKVNKNNKLMKSVFLGGNNNNNYYDYSHNNTHINLNGGSKTGLKKVKTCMCVNYEKMDTTFDYRDGLKCERPVLEGTDFCEKHQDCMKFIKSYMNDFEIDYKPEDWNLKPNIKNSHNCYTYFLNKNNKFVAEKCDKYTKKNDSSKCGELKPQPGDFAELIKNGTLKYKNRDFTCPSMLDKVLKDNPSIKPVKYNEKCPKNSYKGALVVDPNNTYHFYRQNGKSPKGEGTWSHKPGVLSVTDVDASGDTIYFPHLANRNYKKGDDGGINYTAFCSYACVPADSSKVKIYAI